MGVLAFSMMAAGLLSLLTTATAMIRVLLFIILFGTGYGGNNTVRAILVRGHVTEQSYGTALGMTFAFNMIGAAVGPPATGWVYDSYNSYDLAWLVLAISMFVGIGLLLAIREQQAQWSA